MIAASGVRRLLLGAAAGIVRWCYYPVCPLCGTRSADLELHLHLAHRRDRS